MHWYSIEFSTQISKPKQRENETFCGFIRQGYIAALLVCLLA